MNTRMFMLEHADEARDIHAMAFSDDLWVGDDHTFWVAKHNGTVVGFCSAVYRPERGHVFLSRAAVIKNARGHGIQKRMIATRIRWARKQGAKECVTYTSPKNYPSMCSLLACGFKFYFPHEPWAGKSMHYFRMDL